MIYGMSDDRAHHTTNPSRRLGFVVWCAREGEEGAPQAQGATCVATDPTNAWPVPGQAGVLDE